MKKSYVLFFAVPLMLLLFAGKPGENYVQFNDSGYLQTVTYEMVITKSSGDTWEILNTQDSTSSDISVKPGDTVQWKANGTNVFFQFSSSKIFGKSSYNLSDGKSLTLTVSNSAPAGKYTYSAFCAAVSQFVNPDAPPVIIVQRN